MFLAQLFMQREIMKNLMLFIGLGVIFSSFSHVDNATAIINALKVGNAGEVSKYFDNFIDLKLPEKDEIKNIGKNQAGIAFESFFKDNGIKGFDLTSQRDMNGTMYLAGKLQNGGKGYSITILLKTKDANQQVITLRIN
ncbi:DUF4783 domain-containing protein [Parasediminibacterium sp. JCM 36343]|uniref:DUF4783 domain-containing protein n=1 Tax=Parasediminibacterium sp. JCM 36343 TaxID=3374279 RepID=UPI00397AF1AB